MSEQTDIGSEPRNVEAARDFAHLVACKIFGIFERLLDAGAHAYLGKACDAAELVRAIREAARGRRYLGIDIAQQMALGGNQRSPFDLLSRREMEISLMFCQGLRAEDIARRLSLSGKTVATHKYRLFDKLGIKDLIALARMAASEQFGKLVLTT